MSESDQLPESRATEESGADSFLREVARTPGVSRLPAPGQIVAGKYRIERLLGAGAMGAVFAAHHQLLRQTVALKVMLPTIAASRTAAQRFLNEARAMAGIQGEHVVRVLDVGHLESDVPFIALELLEGDDLAKLLAKRGRLSQSEAVLYVLQALEAVAQAHVLGIVHRDLKPANLFLAHRRDGRQLLKVLDFGISKAANPPASPDALTQAATSPNALTQSAAMLGSPLYMSPEQVRDSGTVDARADIWAVGVILFELLTGKPPFEAQTVNQVLARILEQEPPHLRTLRPELPEILEAAIVRCLAKNPEHRFASVAHLALGLAPVAPPEAYPLIDGIQRIMREHSAQLPPEREVVPPPPEPPIKLEPAPLEPLPLNRLSGAVRLAIFAVALCTISAGVALALRDRPSAPTPGVASAILTAAKPAPWSQATVAESAHSVALAATAVASAPGSAIHPPATSTIRFHPPPPPPLQPR